MYTTICSLKRFKLSPRDIRYGIYFKMNKNDQAILACVSVSPLLMDRMRSLPRPQNTGEINRKNVKCYNSVTNGVKKHKFYIERYCSYENR